MVSFTPTIVRVCINRRRRRLATDRSIGRRGLVAAAAVERLNTIDEAVSVRRGSSKAPGRVQ